MKNVLPVHEPITKKSDHRPVREMAMFLRFTCLFFNKKGDVGMCYCCTRDSTEKALVSPYTPEPS